MEVVSPQRRPPRPFEDQLLRIARGELESMSSELDLDTLVDDRGNVPHVLQAAGREVS